MSEQQQEVAGARTTISVSRATWVRVGDLRRSVAEREKRDLTMADAVEWMLDRLDAADLP
jgi:hypothetical protein